MDNVVQQVADQGTIGMLIKKARLLVEPPPIPWIIGVGPRKRLYIFDVYLST